MANDLITLLTHKIFVLCVLSWFSAQAIKVILFYIKHKKVDTDYFLAITSGGMPSSHTSITTTFAVLMYKQYGISSEFFISLLILILTVHYVLLLHKHTARHAQTLNELLRKRGEKLSEVVGHKPLEVFVGFVLGLAIGLLFG